MSMKKIMQWKKSFHVFFNPSQLSARAKLTNVVLWTSIGSLTICSMICLYFLGVEDNYSTYYDKIRLFILTSLPSALLIMPIIYPLWRMAVPAIGLNCKALDDASRMTSQDKIAMIEQFRKYQDYFNQEEINQIVLLLEDACLNTHWWFHFKHLLKDIEDHDNEVIAQEKKDLDEKLLQQSIQSLNQAPLALAKPAQNSLSAFSLDKKVSNDYVKGAFPMSKKVY